MPKLIITLTTIPPRFSEVGETLGALLNQTAPADEICLYISKNYRRFGPVGSLPSVPDGVTIKLIDEDFGPATKVLGAAKEYSGQNVEILFGDDDILYDQNWAKRFLDERKKQPDSLIAEAGGNYPEDAVLPSPQLQYRPKSIGYKLQRALCLGLYRPRPYLKSGFAAQFCGYGGALVRPDFFSQQCFEIPEVLWTVDDFWLSGCLATQGIGIWVNAHSPNKRRSSAHYIERLVKYEEQGHSRHDANTACVKYFQENFGIWLPS